jgi:hypothetical protein
MTEEMKRNDATRFMVVNAENSEVQDCFEAEGPAKEYAEKLANDETDCEFVVYQKVGSAKMLPKVVWKGAAR